MDSPHSRLALHEAAHAAACLVCGLPVARIEINGSSTIPANGTCQTADLDDNTNTSTIRALIVAALAPHALEHAPQLDNWPVNVATWEPQRRNDADRAARYAKALGFSRVDWLQHVETARLLTRRPRYARLLLELADQLDRYGQLDADEIATIALQVW